MKESLIRDKLINKLELLETGLIFIDKEKYLPNSLGTNGFIDILAKDSNNKFVIIELKKSNSEQLEKDSFNLYKKLHKIKSSLNIKIQILGPAKPMVYKIQKTEIRQFFIKASNFTAAYEILKNINVKKFDSKIFITPTN